MNSQDSAHAAEAIDVALSGTVSISEAAKLLGIKYGTMRHRAWRGSAPVIRIGRTVRIPRTYLDQAAA